ncbi:acyltransferase [Oerskovia sp. Sa1BUA8]|uniref:Acyltransferase n=1 Tax=Oerskovia douganii TaxID=2762210 RepID=A0A9D5YZ84_9CELL|nr:acyltransferase [Oerskovia douganii]MBE7700687.1 acyltransferase [Oerskovia douganii]
MPITLTSLEPYEDEAGNRVESSGSGQHGTVKIVIRGKNNRVVVAPGAMVSRLQLTFDANNGTFYLGANPRQSWTDYNVRIAEDSTVRIGDGVTTTTTVLISAVEGTTVAVGNDVMFASGNQLRGDDGHPIFDIRTGLRVNPARDITVGDHVWMGREAVALGGADIGRGSVIGFRSLVKGRIPNNVIAAGTPARVLRRDIAWERPHLGFVKPYYKPDASTVTKSAYWDLTEDEGDAAPRIIKRSLAGRVRARATRMLGGTGR